MTSERVDGWHQPERVFITGRPGSGKTTMGHQLAQRWSIPHFELDLGEDDEAFDQTRWLIEGGGLWDVERFLYIADLIVWLDLSPVVTIPRILTRHFKLSLQGRNRHRGLRLLVRFIRWQPSYYRGPPRRPTGPLDYSQTRAGTEEILRPYRARVVQLRTPRRPSLATRKPTRARVGTR